MGFNLKTYYIAFFASEPIKRHAEFACIEDAEWNYDSG